MSSSVPIYVVEAFTSGGNEPYTGNPAAVCLLQYDDDISDAEKQSIATNMNISETAYVSFGWTRSGQSSPTWDENGPTPGNSTIQRTIRWFTPLRESPLCGHATLASSKAILTYYSDLTAKTGAASAPIECIEFESKVRGKLIASITNDSPGESGDRNETIITLDFPSNDGVNVELEASSDWLPALAETLLGPSFPQPLEEIKDLSWNGVEKILLFQLKLNPGENPQEKIKSVRPNFKELVVAKTGPFQVEYYIVTVKGEGSEGKPDFYSRVFVPFFGTDEDPVTGAAHSMLGPYWTRKLGVEGQTLYARQQSKRGGDVQCRADGSRAFLGGKARVYIRGSVILK